jgi:hypothetical protein
VRKALSIPGWDGRFTVNVKPLLPRPRRGVGAQKAEAPTRPWAARTAWAAPEPRYAYYI